MKPSDFSQLPTTSRKPARLKVVFLSAVLCLASLQAHALSLMFSTEQPAAVPGPGGPGTTQFQDDDVVFFDTDAGFGNIHLSGNTINDGGLPDINALYLRRNGNVIFSVQSGSANFPFDDDTLVEYDPIADSLSLFYDFDGVITTNTDVDIDGFHLLANGNFLLVNSLDFTLDGQNFEDGDIVEFNPVTESASLYFSEELFAGDVDIGVRAISIAGDGRLLLSAFNEDTGGEITLGGITFGRGDLIAYDITNDLAELVFDRANFGGATEDFDGVHAVIPLPAAFWLFASAASLLGWRARRR